MNLRKYACMHGCMYVCMYAYMYVCMHAQCVVFIVTQVASEILDTRLPLRQVPLLRECSEECLAAIISRFNTHVFFKDDPVFSKGDSSSELYYVTRGAVKVIVGRADGDAKKDEEEEDGGAGHGSGGKSEDVKLGLNSFFGELGLLTNTKRVYDVVAIKVSECVSV
jgi:CRP-like cAMP-binding protein